MLLLVMCIKRTHKHLCRLPSSLHCQKVTEREKSYSWPIFGRKSTFWIIFLMLWIGPQVIECPQPSWVFLSFFMLIPTFLSMPPHPVFNLVRFEVISRQFWSCKILSKYLDNFLVAFEYFVGFLTLLEPGIFILASVAHLVVFMSSFFL